MLRAAKLKPMINTRSFVCLQEAVQLHNGRSNTYVSCKPLRMGPSVSARLGGRAFSGLSVRASPRNAGGDFFGSRHCFGGIRFSAFNAAVTGANGAERGELHGEEADERGKKPISGDSHGEFEGFEETGQCAAGEIHVIVGPMFAGKTTALLRRIRAEIHMGRRVMLVKSDKDTRYGSNFVVSHDGEKMPCWAVADLASFKAKLGDEAYKKLDVIGIDEAQFFKDLYSFCQSAADNDGKTIIVAGLDGDFLRKSFGSTLELIPLADSVMKLTSRCGFCGKPALFTFRKTGDTETEVIGGADVYMPVCRQHYVNREIVLEAGKTVLEAQQVQCDIHMKATAVSG